MSHYRDIRIGTAYDCSDYAKFQQNYLDVRGRRPFPSTRVYIGDTLVTETNSLCCFGPEPDLSKPLIGIFGDSVVQGVGTDSFVSHVSIPGTSVINGGLEGALLENIMDRVCEVQAEAPMICAAVHSGFHNLIYSDTSFTHWEAQFARIADVPVVAMFRITADINAESLERGYDAIYSDTYRRMPRIGDLPTIKEFKAAIDRKNRLIEKMCDMWGRVLIDLDEVLAPRTYEDIGKRFFDVMHPSPEMYPTIGAAISEQLTPHVQRALEKWSRTKTSERSAEPNSDPMLNHGRNYPLW